MIDNYNPYCEKCGACGEEGCCSALVCTQDGGDYCEYYLRQLRFGYIMNRFFYNNLFDSLTKEQQEKYDKEWSIQYDIAFGGVSPQDPAIEDIKRIEKEIEEKEKEMYRVDKERLERLMEILHTIDEGGTDDTSARY